MLIYSVAVQLDLPKSLCKVHPVFHCSLLKPKVSSHLRPALPPVLQPFMVEGDQYFEVKEILDFRGTLKYLVAWKDFPAAQNKLVNHRYVRTPKLIKWFHNQYPDKPK